MKRFFLSLSLLLIVAVMTTSARVLPTVNEKIKQSFKKEFAEAKFVEWREVGNYVAATFVLWDLRAIAFYSLDGQLLGCERTLFYNQLPLAAIKTLDRKLKNVNVLEVVEVSNTEGTFYNLTVEGKDKRYDVKIDAAGNIIKNGK